MTDDSYTDFNAIIDNYDKSDSLPEIGNYANLISKSGTIFKPYVHNHKWFRSWHSSNRVIARRVAEYGPEFIDYMAEEMRFRRSKGFDNVCLVTGDERTGKSTFTQILANTILGHQIPLDKVTFKLADFNKAIAEAPFDDVLIMDEAGVDLYSPEWWDEFQMILVKKLFVIGVKRLTLLLVIPHKDDLNKKIRNRRVKYWFNVNHIRGTLERGYCTVRESVTNEWDQEVFWETLAATRFNQLSGPDWDEYQLKKLDFVNEMNSGEYGTRSNRKDKDRAKLIHLLYTEGKMSQQMIADRMGVSQQAIGQIINTYKDSLASKS